MPAPRPKASDGAGIAIRRYRTSRKAIAPRAMTVRLSGSCSLKEMAGSALRITTAVATTVSNQARTAEK